MAISLPKREPRNLRLRLTSALLLAPPIFFAVFLGDPWFKAIVVAAALAMSWEWSRICCAAKFDICGWVITLAIIGALSAMFLGKPNLILFFMALSAISLFVISRGKGRQKPINMLLGMGLIVGFALTSIWIRDYPAWGRGLMIWLLFLVWLTDIGGYFFGWAIGGRKLAPKISPNKTWSGFFGGLFLASCWSGYWLTSSINLSLVLGLIAGVGISALAQLGDLSVSAVKRRYGVKDSSGLIPGHGGMLDRLDGMLLTAPMLAVVLFVVDRGWI